MQRVPELKGNVSSSLHSALAKGLWVAGSESREGASRGQSVGAAERPVNATPPAKRCFGQDGCAGGLVGLRGFALERRRGVGQRVLSQMPAGPPWDLLPREAAHAAVGFCPGSAGQQRLSGKADTRLWAGFPRFP